MTDKDLLNARVRYIISREIRDIGAVDESYVENLVSSKYGYDLNDVKRSVKEAIEGIELKKEKVEKPDKPKVELEFKKGFKPFTDNKKALEYAENIRKAGGSAREVYTGKSKIAGVSFEKPIQGRAPRQKDISGMSEKSYPAVVGMGMKYTESELLQLVISGQNKDFKEARRILKGSFPTNASVKGQIRRANQYLRFVIQKPNKTAKDVVAQKYGYVLTDEYSKNIKIWNRQTGGIEDILNEFGGVEEQSLTWITTRISLTNGLTSGMVSTRLRNAMNKDLTKTEFNKVRVFVKYRNNKNQEEWASTPIININKKGMDEIRKKFEYWIANIKVDELYEWKVYDRSKTKVLKSEKVVVGSGIEDIEVMWYRY